LHNPYHDQSGWLLRQEFGNGDTIQYHYDLAPNGFYARRVSVTLPDGSVKIVEIGDSVSEVYKRMH
jgi:hypothetical protein